MNMRDIGSNRLVDWENLKEISDLPNSWEGEVLAKVWWEIVNKSVSVIWWWEVNTASNVWSWSWLYKEKVWVDLRFKKLKAWSNITLNELEDEVEIEAEWTWDVNWPVSSTDNAIARYNSTTGKIIQDSNNTISDDWELSTKAVQLDTTYTPSSYTPWKMHWNSDLWMPEIWSDDASVKLLMSELTFKVKNATGWVISALTAVAPNWATWWNPTVWLAQSNSLSTATPVWLMSSASTNNNSIWFVTLWWRLFWVNTSAFSEWDKLYLSPTVAWWITTTKPTAPNYPVRLWVVTTAHATEWAIIVDIGYENDINNIEYQDTWDWYNATTVQWALDEIWETRFWNWFDRVNQSTQPDFSFDDWTRILTVSVKSWESNFSFYAWWKKFTKTTDQTVTIPDATWMYYFYFDTDWVLQYILESSMWLSAFTEWALIAMVYWNETQNYSLSWVWNEMHWIRMDWMTHIYNHFTTWARYSWWSNPNWLVDWDTTYTSIDSWKMWDEDIYHEIASATNLPFIYRLWATWEWTKTTPWLDVAYKNGWDTYYCWNEYTWSTWQLTESTTSTDYWITFFASMPQWYVKIIWQNAYASRNAARDAIETELQTLNTNWLPSTEITFLYAIIVRRNWDLENLDNWDTYVDLRHIRWVGSSNTWWGLWATDVSVDTTNFDNNLSSADDTVQKALETIDDMSVGWSSPLTTKWDIYWYSTVDTRLPVWTNWQVLSADSAETLWIKWIDASSWWGSSNLVNICTVDWQLTTWMVARYIVSDAWTISKVKASVLTRPSTDHLKIDIRLNWTDVTDSIFTSDLPLEIADDTAATNWVYTVDKTTIDNWTVVANDVIYVYITQIWDDVSASDLTLNIEI